MKIISIILLLLFTQNAQAVNRIKKINNYLSEIGSSRNRIEKLYPLYNGYAYFSYRDTNNQIREVWFDAKELKINNLPEETTHGDIYIAYGGYAFLRHKPSYFRYWFLYKTDGTCVLDSITNFTPFYQHLSICRETSKGRNTLLYKKGKFMSRSLISSDWFEWGDLSYTFFSSGEIINNKFLNANGHHVYDKKLRILAKKTDFIEIEKKDFGKFHKIYPDKDKYSFMTTWLVDGEQHLKIYNEKNKKKKEIPTPCFDEQSIYEKKGLIEEREIEVDAFGDKHIMIDVVYNLENGDSIMPENYNYTGYFKDYIICDSESGTSAISLGGKETSQIKLGKNRLNKIGSKWILNSLVTIDSIEYVTGLNSDKYIGITINGNIGILDKDGNVLVEPDKQEIFIDKLYFVCRTKDETYCIYDKKGNIIEKDLLDFYFDHSDLEKNKSAYRYKIDKYHYMFFKLEDGKYQYFLRNKKKSKVFYADEINTEDLSNRFLPIKKDGIWQYLEIK